MFSFRGRDSLQFVLFCVAWLALTQRAAAFVEVFGGPGMAPGPGEFVSVKAVDVNENGIAVGSIASQYIDFDLIVVTERRVFRWDGSGVAPQELQPLGVDDSGRPLSDVAAINDSGVAVGTSTIFPVVGGGAFRPVRWDGVAVVGLDSLSPSSDGVASAINADGTIVGVSTKLGSNGERLGSRAVQWPSSGTAIVELETPGVTSGGRINSRATSINDAGVVAGTTPSGATRWESPATPVVLDNFGAFPGSTGSTASTAINNQGTIVGFAGIFENGDFLGNSSARWQSPGTAGVPFEGLSTFIGNGGPRVADINDVGVAVGSSIKYGPPQKFLGSRPIRWDADSTSAVELEILGTNLTGESSGGANAINNVGYIVGNVSAYDATGYRLGNHAVAWNPNGRVTDLNSLIDPSSGWLLTSAQAISDSGWIVGDGTFDPDGPGALAPVPRSYLLHMAIPEPLTGILGAGALVALFAIRRRCPGW
jgi:hypothetical protein